MKHMLRQYTLIFPPLFGLVQEVSGEGLAEAEAGPDDASEAKSKASADRKAIVDTTNEVAGDAVRAKGGQILDLLWRRSFGVPEVRKCMERLLFHCNRVLFNQITSFVVHGLLTDPHGEFFIQRAGASARGASDGQSIERLWNTQFGIRLKMLPLSYIPVRVARTILFIGHAVCLCSTLASRGTSSRSTVNAFARRHSHGLQMVMPNGGCYRVALEAVQAAQRPSNQRTGDSTRPRMLA